MADKAYIYGLIDPRDNLIHYVGSTMDAASRLDGHLKDKADTPKTRWILDLKTNNMQPVLTVLATVSIDHRFTEEYRWIYLGRFYGWPLTNTVAMKTEKYTDAADDLGEKIFVELDRGLTWDIIRKCIFDMYNLPEPWDIRYAMLISYASLAVLLVLVMIIFARGWLSDDLLTVLSVLSALVMLAFSASAILSPRAKKNMIATNNHDYRQEAKEQVQKMIDDEMSTVFSELSSWAKAGKQIRGVLL